MQTLKRIIIVIYLGMFLSQLAGCLSPTVHWNAIEAMPSEVETNMAQENQYDIKTLPRINRQDAEGEFAYRIGPGDQLLVSVQGRPDLGSQIPVAKDTRRNITLVREDGKVDLALLSGVNVAGMTAKEAAKHIERSYRIVTASGHARQTAQNELYVDVSIDKFQSQSVYLNAGPAPEQRIFLTNTLKTLNDVIAQSTNINQSVDTKNATLVRNSISYQFDYDAYKRGENDVGFLIMQDGDQIYFPPATDRIVYIFGEVPAPGIRTIPSTGLTLLDALGLSGGLDVNFSNYNSIYLLRLTPRTNQSTAYKLKLKQILAGEPIILQAQDRIFVPPSGLTRWSRTWRLALPFFTAGSATGAAHRNFQTERN